MAAAAPSPISASSCLKQASLVLQGGQQEHNSSPASTVPPQLQQRSGRKWRARGGSSSSSSSSSAGGSALQCSSITPSQFSIDPGAGRAALVLLRTRRHANPRGACLASVSLAAGSASSAAPAALVVPAHLELLPVGTHRGRGTDKTLLRYVWDGETITPRDESVLCHMATASGRLNQWFAGITDNLYRAFFPDTKDVTPDYWEWLHWRLTQRFFSSTMQNLSTQSLLLALGMGARKTIAASAAINWLLKDGVGRIARMTVATNFGQTFDSELKRIRFVTSVIFEATIGCEFITPFFPQHFLLLASTANVGKAIALAAFVATAPAFQQALSAGGNLADLTAKTQAQHMLVDMLALAVSATAMYAAKNMKVPSLLPLCTYPLLAMCDLYAVYRELKAVQLRTLNRQRAEMVASAWIKDHVPPTPAQVSVEERLLLPPEEGQDLLPLRIVPLGELLQQQPANLPSLLRTYAGVPYLVRLAHASEQAQQAQGRWPWEAPPQPKLFMSLSEAAQGADILTAVLEAVHLRQLVRDRAAAKSAAGNGSGVTNGSGSAGGQPNGNGRRRRKESKVEAGPPAYALEPMLGLEVQELGELVQRARQLAQRDAPDFLSNIKAAGWKLKPFLLSTKEKEGYVLIPPPCKKCV